jgi:hypothetical protein
VRIANVLVLTLLALAPLRRAEARPSGDLAEIATKLDDDDTVEKTYGALGAQHFARRQWGFTLFSHAGLRDWQRSIAPQIPKLVDLLAVDEKLEWADPDGNTKQTTTPRAEATHALQAVERAGVEPLIAALDRPQVSGPADEVLRLIVRGGPAGHDRASWQSWWAAHRGAPLPNERGQWWLPAIFLVLVAGVAALAFRSHRAASS